MPCVADKDVYLSFITELNNFPFTYIGLRRTSRRVRVRVHRVSRRESARRRRGRKGEEDAALYRPHDNRRLRRAGHACSGWACALSAPQTLSAGRLGLLPVMGGLVSTSAAETGARPVPRAVMLLLYPCLACVKLSLCPCLV